VKDARAPKQPFVTQKAQRWGMVDKRIPSSKDNQRACAVAGTWHIFEMEQWDEDYFNMEVQAYIRIEPDCSGEFQFGLVHGSFVGQYLDTDGSQLEFTWEGNDECDPASGSGCVEAISKDVLEGEFCFHHGDESTFRARRAMADRKRRRKAT
jgi:hypothetical protein